MILAAASVSTETSTSTATSNATSTLKGASTAINDLNYDILSLIYSFSHAPILDCSLGYWEDLQHDHDHDHDHETSDPTTENIRDLFRTVALVSSDLHLSCIQHVKRVSFTLRFFDYREEIDHAHDYYDDERFRSYYAGILAWANKVRPQLGELEINVGLGDYAITVIPEIVKCCDLTALRSAIFVSDDDEEYEETVKDDWYKQHVQYASIFGNQRQHQHERVPLKAITLMNLSMHVPLLMSVSDTVERVELQGVPLNDDMQPICNAIEHLPCLTSFITLRYSDSDSDGSGIDQYGPYCIRSNSLQELILQDDKFRLMELACPLLRKLCTTIDVNSFSPSLVLAPCSQSLESLEMTVVFGHGDGDSVDAKLLLVEEVSRSIELMPKLKHLHICAHGMLDNCKLRIRSTSIESVDVRTSRQSVQIVEGACPMLKMIECDYCGGRGCVGAHGKIHLSDEEVGTIAENGFIDLKIANQDLDALRVPDACMLRVYNWACSTLSVYCGLLPASNTVESVKGDVVPLYL